MDASFVDITDATDRHSHSVPLQLFDEALMKRIGRFPATCGRTILPAAMTTEPGRPCPLCGATTTRT